jgi:hypothetical protein
MKKGFTWLYRSNIQMQSSVLLLAVLAVQGTTTTTTTATTISSTTAKTSSVGRSILLNSRWQPPLSIRYGVHHRPDWLCPLGTGRHCRPNHHVLLVRHTGRFPTVACVSLPDASALSAVCET